MAHGEGGRWLAAAVLAAAILGPDAAAAADEPAAGERVEATGQVVAEPFLDSWRARRDMVGDPVTGALPPSDVGGVEGAGEAIQVYENLALVYAPTDGSDRPVRPLDLGRQRLAVLLDNDPAPALAAATRGTICSADPCLLDRDTGQTVRGPMLAFWEAAGGADWLGKPLTEAYRAPGGAAVQWFEFGALVAETGGVARPLQLGRLFALQQGLSTDPAAPSGVTNTAAFAAPAPEAAEPPHSPFALHSFGPGPQVGSAREIVVSIGQQSVWAYDNGDVVQASLASTGTGVVPEAETPLGTFQILTKYEIQDMEGNIGGYYLVEDVPDVMYFDNAGNALHGTYWHEAFGTRQSRGCVNLPLDVAAWLYDWAPIGTPVTVLP